MALWGPPLSWLIYRIMYPTYVCRPSTSARENSYDIACCGASGNDGADQRPQRALRQRAGVCQCPRASKPTNESLLISPSHDGSPVQPGATIYPFLAWSTLCIERDLTAQRDPGTRTGRTDRGRWR